MKKSPLMAIRRRLRALWRRENGTATIEFCFCVPVLLLLVMASIESGLYMVRSAMMERGLDLAMRDFRLGRLKDMQYSDIRNRVCDYTIYIADCENNLKVWIEPIDTTTTPWTLPLQPDANGVPTAYCGDRNEVLRLPVPGVTSQTTQNEFVLIRVCALEDPIFPSTAFSMRLTKDSLTGRYELASSTVVVTEPD